MRRLKVTIAATALLLGLVTGSAGQEFSGGSFPGGPSGGPAGGPPPGRFGPRAAIFEHLDADGDGKLSANEIEQASEALKQLDRNGDGELSADEVGGWAGPPEFRGGRDGSRRPGRPDGREERAGQDYAAAFMARDANADGTVIQEELHESAQPLFPLLDLDGNGGIDQAEAGQLVGRLISLGRGGDWLAQFGSDEALSEETVASIRWTLESARETEIRAVREVGAQRRSEWSRFGITVAAMLIGVISLGRLLTSPPIHGQWREMDVSPVAVRRTVCSLAIIAVLSGFDLFWTTLHAGGDYFQELNPLASSLVGDTFSSATFKVSLVGMSLLLLFLLRRFRGAQIASWWMCFVCTLLTFRWLVLDSSILS